MFRFFTRKKTNDAAVGNPVEARPEEPVPEAAETAQPAKGQPMADSEQEPRLDVLRGLNEDEQEIAQAILHSKLFDEDWFTRRYKIQPYDALSPLGHFVREGLAEEMDPNAFFSVRWCREHCRDPEKAKTHPLLDYIAGGWRSCEATSPLFATQLYLKAYPDVAEAGVEPLSHYLMFGREEGRARPHLPSEKGGRPGLVDENALLPVRPELRASFLWENNALVAPPFFNPDEMHLHFVVPDFRPGGGGHMTIFRMVHFLELAGHRVTIWINNPTWHQSSEDAYETIVKHFQHFKGDVFFADERLTEARGDAIIATDFYSVAPVLAATHFIRRFYMVQDFEPAFHPVGAQYLLASATYHEDLDCICASPWLEQKMREDYGRWASHFMLAADPTVYHAPKEKRVNTVPRIAVYARHFTARRAVELAFLALEDLARRGVAFEVDFFGADLTFDAAPFAFRDHGVLTPEELASLFGQCDLGLVFSATNYSLVPQEMMACGLALVELDGESTRAIFPEDVVCFAGPAVHDIADKLEHLIADKPRRDALAEAGAAWVADFSWEKSAKRVEEAIAGRLAEFSAPKRPGVNKVRTPKASIVIPTWNAGPVFERVLASVSAQVAPWDYEILVIDSGSTDGTDAVANAHKSVRLHRIEQKDFNHGDTRNLGVEITSGDYIAFLTHDAEPTDNRWLFKLVTGLEHYGSEAAGAFGRHIAWPDASPYTKRDMEQHFYQFDRSPLALRKDTDIDEYENNQRWRQKLHFYSDNNSCMRRDVWREIPYPRTRYGEDQLWAQAILDAGLAKVYVPRATVFHSHDFDAAGTFERAQTEGAFFKHFFGYTLIESEKRLHASIEAVNSADYVWGNQNHLPAEVIKHRQAINSARLKGLFKGNTGPTEGLFD